MTEWKTKASGYSETKVGNFTVTLDKASPADDLRIRLVDVLRGEFIQIDLPAEVVRKAIVGSNYA